MITKATREGATGPSNGHTYGSALTLIPPIAPSASLMHASCQGAAGARPVLGPPGPELSATRPPARRIGARAPLAGAAGHAPAVLDRRGELVLDVPGEVDPLRLLELLDADIHDRASCGLRVERSEIGLGQKLAYGLRRLARVDEIIDEQVAGAISANALQYLYAALRLGRLAGAAGVVARNADRVDQANVELARDQRSGDQATARDGDDAFPRPLLVQHVREMARIAVQLDPGDDDLVFVRYAGHAAHFTNDG